MKLEKLILKDFLTYESLEYDFENRPLLIQGRNLTDEGQASNGSGKSGIQTAIEFCITSSNSRGVRDAELVSYGKNEANTQLIISCDQRKEIIHIDWIIKVKGSNKLSITIKRDNNDWEEVSFSNVNDGKKWVIDWIGISKDDLFNYFLINKARFKSFFDSSNREKVDLINRFSDASIIEGLENIDTSDLESEFSQLEKEEVQIQTRIDVKNEELQKEYSRNLDEEFEELIEDIDDDISTNLESISGYEEHIKSSKESIENLVLKNEDLKLDIKDGKDELEEHLKELENHLSLTEDVSNRVESAKILVDEFKGLDLSLEKNQNQKEIDDNKSTILDTERKIKDYENKKSKLSSLINNINIKLSGTISCPSCNHQFLLDEESSIEELEDKKIEAKKLSEKIEELIASDKAAINILNEDIKSFKKVIKELIEKEDESLKGKSKLIENLNSLQTSLTNHETKLRRLNREKGDIEDSIKNTENKINLNKINIKREEDNINGCLNSIETSKQLIKTLEAKKKSLKPLNNESNINILKEEIGSLEQLKTVKTKEKNVVGDEIYKKNQWKNNFKQFRLHLANKSLEVIEYHSNRYLKEMGSDLRVELEGYKVLANGSIKDEITTKIIRDTERSFHSFSGGEKGRLLFASILANRYMINNTHKYGGLDFLSIDEIFEGVDAVGLKSLVKSAKELEIAVMIITHVSDENVSDDILMIEKVNGLSKIVKN